MVRLAIAGSGVEVPLVWLFWPPADLSLLALVLFEGVCDGAEGDNGGTLSGGTGVRTKLGYVRVWGGWRYQTGKPTVKPGRFHVAITEWGQSL